MRGGSSEDEAEDPDVVAEPSGRRGTATTDGAKKTREWLDWRRGRNNDEEMNFDGSGASSVGGARSRNGSGEDDEDEAMMMDEDAAPGGRSSAEEWVGMDMDMEM